MTKDILYYIYSLNEKTKKYLKDKFFKDCEQLSEATIKSLGYHCTQEYLKYNIPETNYKFNNIKDKSILTWLNNNFGIEKFVNKKIRKWSKENKNLPLESYPACLSDLNY